MIWLLVRYSVHTKNADGYDGRGGRRSIWTFEKQHCGRPGVGFE
jgi:hypothetical protein